MNRRQMIQRLLYSGLIYGTGTLPHILRESVALPLQNRILANLILLGGPDLRHLFPPALTPAAAADTSSFAYNYWLYRQRAHSIGSAVIDWETRWNNDFLPKAFAGGAGTDFGILGSCTWLSQMWDDGKLAIVCNALGSTSRDHDHSILVLDQGNLTSGPSDVNRSGWGGRLASASGGNALALTSVPRVFCYGLHPDSINLGPVDINQYDTANLIAAADTSSFGLYEFDEATSQRHDRRGRMARSLRSYYDGQGLSIVDPQLHALFMDHEAVLREFGEQINTRLASEPRPDGIHALYQSVSGIAGSPLLRNTGFGRQIGNLRDCIVANDILNLRVASLDYGGGWDSHDNQRAAVEPNWLDLFGPNRGFDALWQTLSQADRENTVITIAGEFGRQIRDNGGFGTDHGRGNIMMVIGEKVNGGVYGDMFPYSEVAKLNDTSQGSPDIDGLTEFDHHFGAVCDWVSPASSPLVFPDMASAMIETPGMFSGLML